MNPPRSTIRLSVFAAILTGSSLLCGTLYSSVKAAQNPPGYTVANNDSLQDAARPSLAIDAKGNAVIGLIERTNGVYQAFIKRWNGKAWTVLGGALNLEPKFNAFNVAVKLDRTDAPVAAWTERSNTSDGKAQGPGKVYAARWDGKSWKRFGESPTKKLASASDLPKLALDPKGYPVMGWSELSPDFNADSYFVDRWDGSSWKAVDTGSLSSDVSGSSRSRDLAVTSSGDLILAWSVQPYITGKGPQDFNVFVGPWNGNKWAALADASLNTNPNAYAGSPSLALDAQDRPVVAYKEAKAGFDVFVKRWTGSAWQALGGSVDGDTGLADGPSLALDKQGNPTVAWLENAGAVGVFVRRWDGVKWVSVGDRLNANPKAYALECAISLDAKGQPVVAWAEEVSKDQRRVLVRRWNGKAWVGL
jgi:hypothetical protein